MFYHRIVVIYYIVARYNEYIDLLRVIFERQSKQIIKCSFFSNFSQHPVHSSSMGACCGVTLVGHCLYFPSYIIYTIDLQ